MAFERRIALVVGLTLVAASLGICFSNAVAAGFFLIVGTLTTLSAFVNWKGLKSFSVSPASIAAEFREEIDRAEELLTMIKEVESRIYYVLTEQMLNKGGHRYVGGFGEEAKFNIVKAIASAKSVASGELADNIDTLRTRLGMLLVYAVIGAHSRKELSPNTIDYLISTGYRQLPSRERLEALAKADGIDTAEVSDVLAAYEAFVGDGTFPSEDIVSKLYDLGRRREP